MSVSFRGTENYVASPELMGAVDIAVALQKPLLIKGEPGTGKTMLAQAVADALGKKLIIWNVKSTTKAQDGLYVYDVVQRLYDSQFGSAGVDDIAKYIKLGKLGEAFSSDEQVVLLIDEVDKADLEFPNDLLWELDKMEFYIPETKETVKAKQRPIVIITSNAEKALPAVSSSVRCSSLSSESCAPPVSVGGISGIVPAHGTAAGACSLSCGSPRSAARRRKLCSMTLSWPSSNLTCHLSAPS